jgi:tRNA-2-methylthio-N6-dimethylallyladenosine synthase
MGFVQAFAFKYSPRPHTPALKLLGTVHDEVKRERLARLLALVEEQGARHLASLVGTTAHVLVEGASKSGASLQGRTERNEIVHIGGGDTAVGAVVTCEIVRANKHSLVGHIVGAPTSPLPPPRRPTPRVALPVIT